MAKRGNSINRKKRRKAKKAHDSWTNQQSAERDWFELPYAHDDDDDEREPPRPNEAEICRVRE